MLALNKAIDKLHRTRAIQRHHGNNIFKDRRLELTKIALHTSRLKLEYTCRIAALE
ncbi:hypothetical protein D9M68_1001290 [compost metagenome]